MPGRLRQRRLVLEGSGAELAASVVVGEPLGGLVALLQPVFLHASVEDEFVHFGRVGCVHPAGVDRGSGPEVAEELLSGGDGGGVFAEAGEVERQSV